MWQTVDAGGFFVDRDYEIELLARMVRAWVFGCGFGFRLRFLCLDMQQDISVSVCPPHMTWFWGVR